MKAAGKIFLQLLLATALTAAGRAATITNGGFESGLTDWRPLWTREAKAGSLAVDRETAHSGKSSARIEHRGEKDWSLEPVEHISVQPGDVFELEAWVKLARASAGDGSATLCVATYDAQGRAIDWSFGARTVREVTDWRRVQSRLVLPEGVSMSSPAATTFTRTR